MKNPADKIAEFAEAGKKEMQALQYAASEMVETLLQLVKEDANEKTS